MDWTVACVNLATVLVFGSRDLCDLRRLCFGCSLGICVFQLAVSALTAEGVCQP